MKIGITCYPTYGGSGVVAAELGIELANRGDELSSSPQRSRFDSADQREKSFPRSPSLELSAVRISTLLAGVGDAHVGGRRFCDLDLLHVHYAIPHSVSAHACPADAGAQRPPTSLCHHAARNRHHPGGRRSRLLCRSPATPSTRATGSPPSPTICAARRSRHSQPRVRFMSSRTSLMRRLSARSGSQQNRSRAVCRTARSRPGSSVELPASQEN